MSFPQLHHDWVYVTFTGIRKRVQAPLSRTKCGSAEAQSRISSVCTLSRLSANAYVHNPLPTTAKCNALKTEKNYFLASIGSKNVTRPELT